MYFWLKLLHIAAMAVWFAGLFFLPRLLIARGRAPKSDEARRSDVIARALYFGLMTPAAAITIALGIALLAYGFHGAWLPAKLCLVALAVLLHVYCGQLLMRPEGQRAPHTDFFYRALSWAPLLVLLGVSALVAAKPQALPPLGGV